MDFSEIGLNILQILSPFLVAALTWAAARLASYINSKIKNEYLRGVLVRLDEAVVTVVKDLQQTVVEEIKASNIDGKIPDAEKRRIKETALANLKSYLGAKGIKMLAQVLGFNGCSLDGFLSSKIESAVHDLKLTERRLGMSSPSGVGNPDPLEQLPVGTALVLGPI